MKVLAASTESKATAGGPVFFSTQVTMVSAVRPPLYSVMRNEIQFFSSNGIGIVIWRIF